MQPLVPTSRNSPSAETQAIHVLRDPLVSPVVPHPGPPSLQRSQHSAPAGNSPPAPRPQADTRDQNLSQRRAGEATRRPPSRATRSRGHGKWLGAGPRWCLRGAELPPGGGATTCGPSRPGRELPGSSASAGNSPSSLRFPSVGSPLPGVPATGCRRPGLGGSRGRSLDCRLRLFSPRKWFGRSRSPRAGVTWITFGENRRGCATLGKALCLRLLSFAPDDERPRPRDLLRRMRAGGDLEAQTYRTGS
ncbi:uncharacterized protein LOC112625725 [Theropithecus gelada]|uniref:uncharacterized protein LOC112625725 n=1 Tax=Theropithecus gelada TaxID=9565 RepID=UPI000DC1B3F1|nr:uncharacterized protein LOC112625725 [Theropithecus gelada]